MLTRQAFQLINFFLQYQAQPVFYSTKNKMLNGAPQEKLNACTNAGITKKKIKFINTTNICY